METCFLGTPPLAVVHVAGLPAPQMLEWVTTRTPSTLCLVNYFAAYCENWATPFESVGSQYFARQNTYMADVSVSG